MDLEVQDPPGNDTFSSDDMCHGEVKKEDKYIICVELIPYSKVSNSIKRKEMNLNAPWKFVHKLSRMNYKKQRYQELDKFK